MRKCFRALLDQGYDPNAFDNDSWTPLHYCAFNGKLKVAQVLMTHATTDVNLKNKKGETPLHFAAMNGFHHLVELILSNAKIDKNIKNNRGLTPLDMCKQFPKAAWVHCAIALSDTKNTIQVKNLEVYCGEKELLHMHCDDRTTADQLRDEIFNELRLGPKCSKLFAIWISGDRLELQLKGEQKVLRQLQKYPQYLESWGEALSFGRPGVTPNDTPSVVFKRKAMASTKDDKELCQNNADVITLLFNEAMKNFLNGLLPCDDKDLVFLAAILSILRFGKEPVREYTLGQIYPSHMIPQSKKHRTNLISKIETEIRGLEREVHLLQYKFLNTSWSSTSYGCTWFKATMHMSKPNFGSVPVQVGINDYGVTIINLNNHATMVVLKHRELEPSPVIGKNRIDFNVRKGTIVFTLSTNQTTLIGNILTKWRDLIQNNKARKLENEKLYEAAKGKEPKMTERKKSEKSSPLKRLINI